ncbi:MAG TPA: hypothetical protein VFQ92_13955 [Blastocatellia bacterium]|nr:hypothetical protein [Blastocatellia bacterium]
MSRNSEDCYIDIWKEKNFEGDHLRLEGPAEFPTLTLSSEYWGDHISSLRVGPTAFVLAYKDKNFKDRMVSFGPCQEVADLSHYKLDDGIDSIKIIDSLKILYRPPATASEDERAEIQNSEKGERKRRGKKKR